MQLYCIIVEAVATEKFQRIQIIPGKTLEYQTVLIFEMFSAFKGKKGCNGVLAFISRTLSRTLHVSGVHHAHHQE
jgi:hypothetical protein